MSMMTLAAFQPLDWIVLGGYFALLAGTGWWLSRREQLDTRDYFLAGRRMPVWAAAVSLMATALSGATFIGGPEFSYRGDLTFLIFGVSQLIGVGIVAWLFIPAFYRHDVATVYGLLERRFGVGARSAASWMFMAGRVLASGARLYIAALAGALVLFGDIAPEHVAAAIGLMVIAGIFYTLMGGIEAVVWSDVIQAAVFVAAAGAALWIVAAGVTADWGQVFEALRAGRDDGGSKLTIVAWGAGGFGGAETWTLATALTGWVLVSIGSFGTDQDLTQRMLTCRTAAAGARSAVAGIAISIPVTLLFLAVGLGLWVFYERPELTGGVGRQMDDSRQVFLQFILEEMPAGMSGLMMAGLFAAGLSSLNSALNAMSSTFVNDFYRRAAPGRSEGHYLRVGRVAVMGWGLVLGGFAVASIWIERAEEGGTLIDYALGVMTLAYAGLVAVYLTGLLTRRGNGASAVAAMGVGFTVVLVLWVQPWVWVGGDDWRWDLAAPWRMCIATAAAFVVCCAGRQRQPV